MTKKDGHYTGPDRRKNKTGEDHKTLRFHVAGDAVAKVLVTLIKYGVYAFIAYQTAHASIDVAHEWAGKTTLAKVDVDVHGKLEAKGTGALEGQIGSDTGSSDILLTPYSLDPWVVAGALIIALMGLSYGKRQGKLRKDVVEQMHQYQLRYEESLDPKRSSSKLTTRGDTRPGDD